MAKFLPNFSERTDRLRKHYAKEKDNIVTIGANTTGLGITLWQKQDNGNTKPIAYRSRYLNDTENK